MYCYSDHIAKEGYDGSEDYGVWYISIDVKKKFRLWRAFVLMSKTPAHLGAPQDLVPRAPFGLNTALLGTTHFGIGTTWASFQTNRTSHSFNDALNIEHTGSARNTENSLRNQLGNSSGPLNLGVLIRLSFDLTWYGNVGKLH
jgi:hypothetical protein